MTRLCFVLAALAGASYSPRRTGAGGDADRGHLDDERRRVERLVHGPRRQDRRRRRHRPTSSPRRAPSSATSSNLVVKTSKIKISGGRFRYEGPAYVDQFRAKTKLGHLVWSGTFTSATKVKGKIRFTSAYTPKVGAGKVTFKKKACDSGTKSWTGSGPGLEPGRCRLRLTAPRRTGQRAGRSRRCGPAGARRSDEVEPRAAAREVEAQAPGRRALRQSAAHGAATGSGTFGRPPPPATSWRMPSWSASRCRSWSWPEISSRACPRSAFQSGAMSRLVAVPAGALARPVGDRDAARPGAPRWRAPASELRRAGAVAGLGVQHQDLPAGDPACRVQAASPARAWRASRGRSRSRGWRTRGCRSSAASAARAVRRAGRSRCGIGRRAGLVDVAEVERAVAGRRGARAPPAPAAAVG